MIILLTILHVVVCVVLVLVVLLQQGKSADFSGAFGGGGSQTTFGARGSSTFLTKATPVAAILFIAPSLSLTILIPGGTGGGPVIREGATAPAPAAPPTPAAPAAGQ